MLPVHTNSTSGRSPYRLRENRLATTSDVREYPKCSVANFPSEIGPDSSKPVSVLYTADIIG